MLKKNIPHIITLTSLCIAILSIIESCNLNLTISSFLIIICFFLDGIDGGVARFLKVESEYGKQLDSFSDMIAFGVAPGILMYHFISIQFNNPTLAYISLLIPICSALRLANYNIDLKQKDIFLGLTTPVSAIFFSSIPLIQKYESNEIILEFFINQYTLGIIIMIICILLISRFETFTLRINLIKDDKRKLFFIFISICILYIFKFSGLPIIILVYIIFSFLKLIN